MIKEITHSLDAWLWRRGFHHELIRAVAKAEIMIGAVLLTLGVATFIFDAWLFYFSLGFVLFALNFCCMAHSVLCQKLEQYSRDILTYLLLMFFGRLLLTAVALYLVLIVYSAPVSAVVSGIIISVAVIILSFVLSGFSRHNRKEA